MELVYTDKNHEVTKRCRVISCSKNLGDVTEVLITASGKVALLQANGLSVPNMSDFSLYAVDLGTSNAYHRVNVVDSRVHAH